MSLNLRQAARLSGRVVYLEIITLVLSLFSLLALVAELTLPLAPEQHELLRDIDTGICLVFLTDFAVHLYLAPSKSGFLKWGWIDLISSLPAVEWVRWGRVFRVVRIVRALRSFQAVREHLALDRARGTFAVVTLASVLAMLFATIAVLAVEHSPQSNIKNAGDALWWAFATITTIGYGDKYPVTLAGRLVAVVLVIFGVSLFGTFTAYVASFFIEKEQKKEESEIHHLVQEVRRLREKIERLEASPPGAAPMASSMSNQPTAKERT
jgi:voltage-gated potassium channel